jgi:hypothetical protein
MAAAVRPRSEALSCRLRHGDDTGGVEGVANLVCGLLLLQSPCKSYAYDIFLWIRCPEGPPAPPGSPGGRAQRLKAVSLPFVC